MSCQNETDMNSYLNFDLKKRVYKFELVKDTDEAEFCTNK